MYDRAVPAFPDLPMHSLSVNEMLPVPQSAFLFVISPAMWYDFI